MKRDHQGFTLIEMLVVVVIIGILAGTIVFNFVGADREQNLRTEAERLALLIEMARSEAVQRNEECGVSIGPAEYRFLVFDAKRGAWIEQQNRPFQPRTVADMAFVVRVDAMTTPAAKSAKDAPLIIMSSSGEQTPFEVEITPTWQSIPWRVVSDGLSRTSAQRRA